MRIQKKDSDVNISCNFDKKRYTEFINKVSKLGKDCESKSRLQNQKYTISMKGMRTPYMKVKGWCSRVVDDNGKVSEILFLDYDDINYWLVKEELKYLMKTFNLPPFYVFTTSEKYDRINDEYYGNYICINLKKNRFCDVIEMQKETHADQAHCKVPLHNRYRTWVLRMGNKGRKPAPKFKEVIGDEKAEYLQEVSNAHLKTLEGLYNIPLIKYRNKDKNNVDKLFFNEYITASL